MFPTTPICRESVLKYLQLPRHGNNIMIRGVVLVTVCKYQSDISSKFGSSPVLSVVQFLLQQKHPDVVVALHLHLGMSALNWPLAAHRHSDYKQAAYIYLSTINRSLYQKTGTAAMMRLSYLLPWPAVLRKMSFLSRTLF